MKTKAHKKVPMYQATFDDVMNRFPNSAFPCVVTFPNGRMVYLTLDSNCHLQSEEVLQKGDAAIGNLTRDSSLMTTQTLAEQIYDLADGGKLVFIKDFLTPEQAQELFDELRESAPWEQKPGLFGHKQPRLTASYGDEGVTYRYSGTVNVANSWTDSLMTVKREIEEIIPRFLEATIFNFCLLNRYRDGNDSVRMHSDAEPGVGNVIGSLSLGATRTFRIQHNTSKAKMEFAASHGSLIIMGGTMQKFWKHGIDKEPKIENERINLTFR